MVSGGMFWGSAELWLILAAVTLGTVVWRIAGVMVAAHINPDGALFQWFSCLAYAMLAGLISRIILFPVGIMAETPRADRLVALALGLVVFFLAKRQPPVGIAVAVLSFAALAGARQYGIL